MADNDHVIKYNVSASSDVGNLPVLYINKQLVKFPGQHIRVFDKNKRLIAKAHALPFKLKEKLRIYSDEEKNNCIAECSAVKIMDFNATFQLAEPVDNSILFTLRRKGLKSELIKDSWVVSDAKGVEVASLEEPNTQYSIIRRLLFPYLRQKYRLQVDGAGALDIKQSWTPFLLRYTVQSEDYNKITKKIPQKYLATILCTIASIEGRE